MAKSKRAKPRDELEEEQELAGLPILPGLRLRLSRLEARVSRLEALCTENTQKGGSPNGKRRMKRGVSKEKLAEIGFQKQPSAKTKH